MANYWQGTLNRRLSRRRAIATSGALGAAAAFLAACGGDDGDGGSGTSGAVDRSGLIHQPQDTTAGAKTGGVLKHFFAQDITHFDAAISDSSQTSGLSASPFYPKLMEFGAGKHPTDADGSSEGEAATSWELSPDKLTLTVKLRQGMVWDRRAPTNGRALDAQDVLFTWGKYAQFNPGAVSIAYNATTAPGSAIESWSSPDSQTVVAKLHAPDASIVELLSSRFHVMPRESETGFDPKTEVRGAGPFVLEEYVPSARFVWAKNPDYYRKGKPYYDKVELPIIQEQAARLAQFRTGNIYTDVLFGSQEDIVPTKKEIPELVMLQTPRFPERVIYFMTVGWEEGSPFRDERMRRALAMTIDREAFSDVIDNRDRFAADGIDVPVRWNSVVGAGWGQYWLDPTDSKFGENAKYLELHVDQSKQLMTAAGQGSGMDVKFNVLSTGQFGPIYGRIADVYAGMMQEAGFRPTYNNMEFNDWVNNISQGYRSAPYKAGQRKGFDGIGMQGERGYPTPAVQVYNQFNAAGQGYRGNSATGQNIADGDPFLNDLTVRINREFDRNRQIDMVHELIRYATGKSYYVPQPSAAKAFELWWPAISNNGVYTPFPGTNLWSAVRPNWWIDSTKAPLARS